MKFINLFSLQLLNFYRINLSFKNSRIMRNILLLMTNEICNLSNSDLRNIALVSVLFVAVHKKNRTKFNLCKNKKIPESRFNKRTSINSSRNCKSG